MTTDPRHPALNPRGAGLTYRLTVQQIMADNAPLLASMTPSERVRFETNARKAALNLAHRKLMTAKWQRGELRARNADGTSLADELISVASQIARLTNSTEAITAAALNVQIADELIALQNRARTLLDQVATIMPSVKDGGTQISYATPSGAITASMESLDPKHFARKVRAQRRMNEIRRVRARQAVAKTKPMPHAVKLPPITSSGSPYRDPANMDEIVHAMPEPSLICGPFCSHRLDEICPRESEAKRRDRERAADKNELNRAVRLAEEAERRRQRSKGM